MGRQKTAATLKEMQNWVMLWNPRDSPEILKLLQPPARFKTIHRQIPMRMLGDP